MIARSTLLAEGLGTGFLLAVIVGSGWSVELLGAPPATQLFIHAVVVGLGLAVAIVMFIPISGAQFNPVVTMALALRKQLDVASAVRIVIVQLIGGLGGLAVANLTFASEIASLSTNSRIGPGSFGGEVFATFGLVLVILVLVDTGRASAIPLAVGAWVATIIVATVSTGFANPVVTIGRTFTDSYTGIEPGSVFPFIVAQVLGAGLAVGVTRLLVEETEKTNV